MAENALKLPAHISPDGREVWGWAEALSARAQLADKIRTTRKELSECRRCGACSMWMTRQCPRETHDNRTGRSSGPSMKGEPCSRFREKPHDVKRREELAATLQTLLELANSPQTDRRGVGL